MQSEYSRWRTKSYGQWLTMSGLLMLLAPLGCSDLHARSSSATPVVVDIPILRQENGTYSPLSRRARILVRNQATLAQLPLTEIPVDFQTEMLLVCGLGPMPDDRSGVRIARVWKEGNRIRVQEQAIYPATGRQEGLRPASPWTAVVIPRSNLNVQGYTTRIAPGLLKDHLGAR